jgi:nicotinate-nucleotide adenylyltransferase
MRIAIFGGSFDPVHVGHLVVAESARTAFSLDTIIFMPANIAPHKNKLQAGSLHPGQGRMPCYEAGAAYTSASLSAEERCACLRAALKNNPYFELSTHELDRGGISYTIDTLLAFGAREDAPVYCIIGADLAPHIGEWHRPLELARLARFIAAGRDGMAPEAPPPFHLEYFACPPINVSSSMIRERIAQGQSVRSLVPEAVYELIRENNYYAQGGTVNSDGVLSDSVREISN